MTRHFGICRSVDKSICSLWGLETWHIKDHREKANQAVVMELSRRENEWTSRIAFPLAHWQYLISSGVIESVHYGVAVYRPQTEIKCHNKVLYRATLRLLLRGSRWHDWNIKTHTFQVEPLRTSFICTRPQITFHTLNKSRWYPTIFKNNDNL